MIITIFFIIIGVHFIVISNNPHMIIISILWLLSAILLMILVYHSSLIWGPDDPDCIYPNICFTDQNSGFFDSKYRMWLLTNLLFILILSFSVLWTSEISNQDSQILKTFSGLFIILGGIVIHSLCAGYNFHLGTFWVGLCFFLIWLIFTFYSAISD